MERKQLEALGALAVVNLLFAVIVGFIISLFAGLQYLPMHTDSTAYDPVRATIKEILWDIVDVSLPRVLLIAVITLGVYFINYGVTSALPKDQRKKFCLCVSVMSLLFMLSFLVYDGYVHFQKHAPFFY